MAVTISRPSLLAGGVGFLAAALGTFAWTEIGGRTASEGTGSPAVAAPLITRPEASQQELLDALGRIEAALERIDGRLLAESKRQQVPAPGGSETALAENVHGLVAELRALVLQLQSAEPLGRLHGIVERPAGLARITLPALRDLSSEELRAAVQWRTYADVYASLGAPTRVGHDEGSILWEYVSEADGSRLNIRFIDGHVVAAWDY